MATPLKPYGPATIGRSIAFGAKADSNVSPTTPNNRVITRDFEMRVEDHATHIVSLENPTVYDDVYKNALIVSQSLREKPNDKATAILTRVFAEVPAEWDDYIERVETFFGVAQSMIYAPAEFKFRNGMVSIRARCRVNRRYFLNSAEKVVELAAFQPTDSDGVAVSVITDYTVPSSDEYIAMSLGRQEIVISSVAKRWMGAINVLETVYAPAK